MFRYHYLLNYVNVEDVCICMLYLHIIYILYLHMFTTFSVAYTYYENVENDVAYVY
jgi:hypothetical protein